MATKYKILYILHDSGHTRVFKPITKDDRVDQRIVISPRVSANKTIFKIPAIKCESKWHFNRIVCTFKPDVIVQCTNAPTKFASLKKRNIKIVYVHHGIWRLSPNNINRLQFDYKYWSQFDLLCGATNVFKNIFEKHSDIKVPVIINCLTQFDLVYENILSENKNAIRASLLKNSNLPNADKIITLFMHKCKDSKSVAPYNVGYYTAAVELARVAEKYNFLLIMKQKFNKTATIEFINTHSSLFEPGMLDKYMALYNNKYVKFLPENSDTYSLFVSDMLISSAPSTIDVEASIANKPYARINILDTIKYNYTELYETGVLNFDAAYCIDNINSIEKVVLHSIYGDNTKLFENQKRFKDHLEIIFDGQAHVRLIDNIIKILK